MTNLSSAKTLGGIGSIFMVVGGLIPAIGTVLVIAGFVLVLIAVRYISDETKDAGIIKNYLFAFIFSVLALVVAGFVILTGFFSLLTDMEEKLLPFFRSLILALIALWILLILSAIFLRKSFKSISEKTKVGLFSTTATVYLLGSALVIVLIGFIVILIAMILQIVAFFSLPEKIESEIAVDKT